MSFEDELRAALTTKADAPMVASPVEVDLVSMPKRRPSFATVIYGPGGEIKGILWEDVASVTRGPDGEIETFTPLKGAQ